MARDFRVESDELTIRIMSHSFRTSCVPTDIAGAHKEVWQKPIDFEGKSLVLPMKIALITFTFLVVSFASGADRISPYVESIGPEGLIPALEASEDYRTSAPTVRRGLVGNQMTYRARSAQWFIEHGTLEDVPFLIDALSDQSHHEGANYPLAGMATTRYWANVALIVICKTSYDYQWDAPAEKREYSISQWIQHWNRIKPKAKE